MENSQIRVLRRALESIGSLERLAEVLGTRPEYIHAWIASNAVPPHHIFLAALDIVERGPLSQHPAYAPELMSKPKP
jgi:hypothetical protein